MASKNNNEALGRTATSLASLWELRRRIAVVAPLSVLGALSLISVCFHRYTAPRLQSWPEYELTPERWEVTQRPNWIRRDVVREAVNLGDLHQLSLLDPQLAEKTSRAFLLCSWVKEVNRVEKRYPAKVRVDVTYRKPVAMVEGVDDQMEEEGVPYFPVDESGVLLPTSDFSKIDLGHYPRICIPNVSLQGPAGASWGDPRIEQAARIAGAILEHYQDWGIDRIEMVPSPADGFGGKGPFLYRLVTPRGLVIDFGHAPGLEDSAEPTVGQKIRWLIDYKQKNGKLSDLDAGLLVDLRNIGGIVVKPALNK